MHIGVDGNEANVEKKVGVSLYAIKLLQQFYKRSSNNLRFTVFLRSEPRTDMPQQNDFFKYEVVKGRYAWSQIFLPIALYKKYRHLDVFFSPAHYAPRFCPVPTVVTLHDLSYFYYPNDFKKSDLLKLDRFTRYSVLHAKRVIAVSNRTKYDAIREYRLPEGKTTSIPNGFEIMPPFDALEKKDTPYFLYIGTLQPRKNIETLLYAFADIHTQYPKYTLHIVGKKGWMYEPIFETVKSLKLTNHVLFHGYIPEQQKCTLLSGATALVVPGLYEGFGLPLLEGFYAHIPVISSNGGALPEVGEDGAYYFNPIDSVSLYRVMKKVIEGEDVKKHIRVGQSLTKKYSWEKTAQDVLRILTTV